LHEFGTEKQKLKILKKRSSEDEKFLLEFEEKVIHYEVFAE